jgi:hypothetical protein
MDFSGLRKKNESDYSHQKIIKIEKLIIANDYYSAKKCEQMFDSGDDFIILGERLIEASDLRLKGPSTFRVTNELSQNESMISSVFYKDQKFRPFGGRSKSMELKPGEKYFSYPKLDHQIEEISEEVVNKINDNIQLKKIVSIEARELDLVVRTGDGASYEVTELYWPLGMVAFVGLLKNKNILSEKMLTSLSGFEGPIPLYIDLSVKTPINETKTVFLPVSLAHEQGHFIGDIKKINEKLSFISFVHFIDPNEVNEDHICRLIKNLKRQIEKLFNVAKGAICDEEITLSSTGVAVSIDDSLGSDIQDAIGALRLIGEQFVDDTIFADSCGAWQSGFRGYKSVDIAALSVRKSVDKNDRELNTYD